MPLLSYILFRLFTFPLQYMPYKVLHVLGKILGLGVYYLYPKYRKRSLSNLALATDLYLTPEQIVSTAKKSLQNLAITALEYPRLSIEKNIQRIATCVNPEPAASIIKSGQGIIFFCGHQTNWELLFLEGTQRMPGVAIGRPINNHYLYNGSWTSVRSSEERSSLRKAPTKNHSALSNKASSSASSEIKGCQIRAFPVRSSVVKRKHLPFLLCSLPVPVALSWSPQQNGNLDDTPSTTAIRFSPQKIRMSKCGKC